jgi:cysteine desulfurase
MKKRYMDRIAATPLDPQVYESMAPFLKEDFGNPQSLHSWGQKSNSALETARQQVAHLIHAEPEEIIFTASGSESNNLAVKGLAEANRKQGDHIIVSAVEHQSVLNSAQKLEKKGFKVDKIPVDKYGLIDLPFLKRSIKEETVLVSVMLANSEVGTIEPIEKVAEICRAEGVLLHTDAVAAVGSIEVDVNKLGVDALSLAGDQFYGPKGSAALYIRKGTRLVSLIEGGVQEGGRRAGTENLPAIVGLGEAAELAEKAIPEQMEKITKVRDHLIRNLPEKIEHVVLTGHPEKRLSYHASFCVEFIEGESMLLNLDMLGIAVSSGSACTSKALRASHVLIAMGLDHALAQSSLVFSLLNETSREDIDYLLDVFPPVVERLRKMSPLYSQYLEERKNDIQR